MSFDKLLPESAIQNEKVVEFTINDQVIKFYARSMSYFDFETIATDSRIKGTNQFAQMVTECVYDENNNRMTYEQACRLPQEYAQPLFLACLEVNGFLDANKKK